MEDNANKASQAKTNPQNSGQTTNAGNNINGSAKSNKNASGKSSQQDTSGKGGLSGITDKLQQFGSSTAEKVGNLSTTQKVVGGSLLALGAGWVAMNSMNKKEKMRANVRKRN